MQEGNDFTSVCLSTVVWVTWHASWDRLHCRILPGVWGVYTWSHGLYPAACIPIVTDNKWRSQKQVQLVGRCYASQQNAFLSPCSRSTKLQLCTRLLENNFKCFSLCLGFLSSLSLYLNHLIASWVANNDWPFGTLPFGLFGSQWTLWHVLGPILVIFDICFFLTIPGLFEYFSENGCSEEIKLFSIRGQSSRPFMFNFSRTSPKAKSWANLFPSANTKEGATGCQRSSTIFLTYSRNVKGHFIFWYCINNLPIGVA